MSYETNQGTEVIEAVRERTRLGLTDLDDLRGVSDWDLERDDAFSTSLYSQTIEVNRNRPAEWKRNVSCFLRNSLYRISEYFRGD